MTNGGKYTGPDTLGYVISVNLNRRHLNESQRAMVAARLANLTEGRLSQTASIEQFLDADGRSATGEHPANLPDVPGANQMPKSGTS